MSGSGLRQQRCENHPGRRSVITPQARTGTAHARSSAIPCGLLPVSEAVDNRSGEPVEGDLDG